MTHTLGDPWQDGPSSQVWNKIDGSWEEPEVHFEAITLLKGGLGV